MSLTSALRGVNYYRRLRRAEFNRIRDDGPKGPVESQAVVERGRTLDRFYDMNYEASEIYNQDAYDKCRRIIALRFLGYTPRDIDEAMNWPLGTSLRLEQDHPKLLQRAEQVHIESVYRKFHQAKIKELDILSGAILPSILLLEQVVAGGTDMVPPDDVSRLGAPVAGSEVSLTNRIAAAKTLLGFAQERLKQVSKDDEAPVGMAQLPEEFKQKFSKNEDRAMKLVPLAEKVGN